MGKLISQRYENEKKYFVSIAILMSIILLIFITIVIFPKKKVLTCVIKNNGYYNWVYEKYIFTGHDDIIKLEERYCKLKDDEKHEIINKYYDMLKDDDNVKNIKIKNNTIEWYEKRSMVKYQELDNCKDKKGNILFSKIKKYFEDMDYICNY